MQYGVVSASSPLPLTTAGQHRRFNRCWAPMVVGGLQSLTPPPPFRKALSTKLICTPFLSLYFSSTSRTAVGDSGTGIQLTSPAIADPTGPRRFQRRRA